MLYFADVVSNNNKFRRTNIHYRYIIVYMLIHALFMGLSSRNVYTDKSPWLPAQMMRHNNLSNYGKIWLYLLDIPYDSQCILSMICCLGIIFDQWLIAWCGVPRIKTVFTHHIAAIIPHPPTPQDTSLRIIHGHPTRSSPALQPIPILMSSLSSQSSKSPDSTIHSISPDIRPDTPASLDINNDITPVNSARNNSRRPTDSAVESHVTSISEEEFVDRRSVENRSCDIAGNPFFSFFFSSSFSFFFACALR